jgi:peptide deformylase
VLRKVAREVEDPVVPEIAQLILDMRQLLESKKLGVGLAAPQVGKSVAVAVIAIEPSERRPDAEPFALTIINPKIVETFGRRKQLYEGCISGGDGKAGLFARVPRYMKIKLAYTDEKGVKHVKTFEGMPAHVIQHEVDHLNGILFVDRVKDSTTYITYKEYVKLANRVMRERQQQQK